MAQVVIQEATANLEELTGKFPTIPRSIILKVDLLREGIRYTPLLNKIGKWTIPAGLIGYQMHPEGIEDLVSENIIEVPWEMHFRDGTTIHILLKGQSPYEIRYEGDGSYCLYRDGEAVEEVLFIPRPEWLSKNLKNGKAISTLPFTAINDNFS